MEPLPTTNHPSRAWRVRQFADERGGAPALPDMFERLMNHPDYRRASAYDPVWVWHHHMGPNALWLTEALTNLVDLRPGSRVLDMGCGTAMSSIFLAREFGVQVWAVDWWIDPTDNRRRIEDAGLADEVFPLRVEAGHLPFAAGFFDVLISIDAYHYFGIAQSYMASFAALAKPDTPIGIVVPGRTDGISYADDDTFRSPTWWASHWQSSGLVHVEHADNIPNGWNLWMRFVEASAAWDGQDSVEEQPDGQLLLDNRDLSFTRVVARSI